MSRKNPTETELTAEISAFRQQHQTLLLATRNEQGQPLASYAPFIESASGEFVLLLSDMAEHSQNLHYHARQNTPFSIMLIEDEASARNVFARQRLSYQCQVHIINREQSNWPQMIKQFQQKFGSTIKLLSSLADFRLYILEPQSGHYVRGFGQAYPLNKNGLPLFKT